jgi:hypothetical protein
MDDGKRLWRIFRGRSVAAGFGVAHGALWSVAEATRGANEGT